MLTCQKLIKNKNSGQFQAQHPQAAKAAGEEPIPCQRQPNTGSAPHSPAQSSAGNGCVEENNPHGTGMGGRGEMGILPSQWGSHATGDSCTLVLDSKHGGHPRVRRERSGPATASRTCPASLHAAETGPHGEHGSSTPGSPADGLRACRARL